LNIADAKGLIAFIIKSVDLKYLSSQMLRGTLAAAEVAFLYMLPIPKGMK
jgi:hypothetical protein